MHIEIKSESFDPYYEISQYQEKMGKVGKFGATANFIGTMRDFNEGESVKEMTLEHYPEMTEKHLRGICEQARKQWDVLDCLVMHRVGLIKISDAIVLVAVWSAHRGDAIDACHFIIEDLKSKAPFWKKEQLDEGERWVEKNTSGYST